mmetsp:Transcript_8452/g.27808  ORF Transcript_8452/g.27808 Transcript_8452/m.27808 type:complete len:204 (+) Transcript_8452:317-928(+)
MTTPPTPKRAVTICSTPPSRNSSRAMLLFPQRPATPRSPARRRSGRYPSPKFGAPSSPSARNAPPTRPTSRPQRPRPRRRRRPRSRPLAGWRSWNRNYLIRSASALNRSASSRPQRRARALSRRACCRPNSAARSWRGSWWKPRGATPRSPPTATPRGSPPGMATSRRTLRARPRRLRGTSCWSRKNRLSRRTYRLHGLPTTL